MATDERSFSEQLASLLSREVTQARKDPERLAEMIERLANALAFTISIGAWGDRELAQKLLTAAECYLYESSVWPEVAILSRHIGR
jgi:hypothetical protein